MTYKIEDDIEELLALGLNKIQIFERVSKHVDDVESLGWHLSHAPYPFLRNKFRSHSYFLAGIIFLLAVHYLIALAQTFQNQTGLLVLGAMCFILGFGAIILKIILFRPGAPYLASLVGAGLSLLLIYSAISKGITFEASIKLASTITLMVVGIWLSKQLAPRGVFMGIRVPRNQNNDVEFD